jgi:hypothetical protein
MAAGEIMITKGLKSCTWRIVERQTQQFSRNGTGPVIELGAPYWEIDFRYENLSPENWRLLTSWVNRRRGAKENFSAYRPDRKAPLFRAEANDPALIFTIIETVTEGNKVLVDYPAGVSPYAAVGDMVAYDSATGARYVGEVEEIEAVFSSRTRLRTYPPAPLMAASPNGNLYAATGLFKMVANTLQMSEPYTVKKTLSFRAKQDEAPIA